MATNEGHSGKEIIRISDEDYRWVHDKYERLLHHEESILATYFGIFFAMQAALFSAAIGDVFLVTNYSIRLDVMETIGLAGFLTSFTSYWLMSPSTVLCSLWREGLSDVERSVREPGHEFSSTEVRLRPYLILEGAFKAKDARALGEMISVRSAAPLQICRWTGFVWIAVFVGAFLILTFTGPSGFHWY